MATASEYFSRFPSFALDPIAPIQSEFSRLARQQDWAPESDEFREERVACFSAEFHTHFGNDGTKLEGWQALCSEVRIDPVPSSISQCRGALRGVFVNLVDLINHRRNPAEELLLFPSPKELRKYSRGKNKLFPKELAKEDGFLHALLITMGSRAS